MNFRKDNVVTVQGFCNVQEWLCRFECDASFSEEQKNWTVSSDKFRSNDSSKEIERQLLKPVAKCFKPLWFGPIPNAEGTGFRIQAGLNLAFDGAENANSIARCDLPQHRRLLWEKVWPAIHNRCKFDPDLSVRGFTRDEIIRAIPNLEKYYAYSWIKQKYEPDEAESFGWKELEHNVQEWFPVHHLAALALGVMCRDPGLNALVSLGLSIPQLKKLPRSKQVLNDLRNTGGLHQANLISKLLDLGVVDSIEVPTGLGKRTNDVRVKAGSKFLDLEIKTLTSQNPVVRLLSELREQDSHLPDPPINPVVVVVIPLDTGLSEEEYRKVDQREDPHRLDRTEELLKTETDFLGGLEKISALMFVTPFIDHSGGVVKWKVEEVLTNPNLGDLTKEDVMKAVPIHQDADSPACFKLNSLLQVKLLPTRRRKRR